MDDGATVRAFGPCSGVSIVGFVGDERIPGVNSRLTARARTTWCRIAVGHRQYVSVVLLKDAGGVERVTPTEGTPRGPLLKS